ncbi:MAG: diguanylate cyclase [Acidobacteria bacterium]|nr:diguanylate cyclase [Acidobacteriota bacterium]
MEKRKVLIVDDDPHILVVLVALFERYYSQFEVFQSLDGPTALHIAHQRIPDLIITDWEMPQMDGLELIRRLKADSATMDIPVMMCTGVMTTSTNLKTVLEAGAVDYIRKPIDATELEARVGTILKLAESYRIIKVQNQKLEAQKAALEAANTELVRLSTTDPLTGISNRRKFMVVVEEQMKVAERYQSPFTLVMLDIDHFKGINDQFGHDMGDRVLQHVAATIQSSLRTSDTIARWGGEEFMALLQRTRLPIGSEIAEKLREKLASTPVDQVGLISASFGVTEYQGSETLASLTNRVDEFLYQAKRLGRNRVVAG